MKILHTIFSLDTKIGGPAQVATHLTDKLAENENIRVSLLSQKSSSSITIPTSPNSQVLRLMGYSDNPLSIAFGIPIYKKLNEQAKLSLPDLIHYHGLWHLGNHWSARFAVKNRIPYTLHLHGMLDPWPLQHRRFKKIIGLQLYQNRDLASARLLFATANKEADNIRKFGLTQPIAVIPNGVFLDLNKQSSPTARKSEQRKVLFLGRLHPVKGLSNLLKAWSIVQGSDNQLIIAGPDEANYLQQIKFEINQLKLQSSVHIIGSVEGEKKDNLFKTVDLLILPSFTENFGVVVAEALSYGVPVITTTGAPWSDLKDYQCGWWVEPTVEQIADALKEATSLDSLELQAMGARGREYVKRYDWKLVAQDTLAVYRWILKQGPKPDCVILD